MSTLERLRDALADRYRIERELGAGGMATVYLARDLKHDRDVAIKVLKPELGAALGAERFLAEIKVTANLRHPNVLPLFDSGSADEQLFYVMPYIDGETLRARMTREPQMPVDEVLRIVGLLAAALDYAHANGVVHRDLKPENILLQAGQPIIADFGIALAIAQVGGERVTQTGLSLGTPNYMSPEQAAGERDVDARSDQYALGAMTYEMLTGEPPHSGATAQVIIARLMTETPRSVRSARPAVSDATDAAVQRALSKSPADRFITCTAFCKALAGGATSATRVAVPAVVPKRSSPRNALIFAAVVIAAALLFAWQRSNSGPSTTASTVASTAASTASVAVLPFTDLSPGRANDYLGDGIAETITSALGRVPGLQIAARTSAFSFRGQNVDVRDIGAKLRVATVLTGSVQRAGDKLRITAQLVKTSDGVSQWSDTFDRPATDIFAVQDDVTRAVIAALTGKVLAASANESATATRDARAYDLYLQGRFFQTKRTTDDVTRAIGLFKQAIARDSMFAQAWAGLADAYLVQAFYSNVPAVPTLTASRRAVDRALVIAPELVEAQATHAYLFWALDWNWLAADSAFQRALALGPNYSVAHKWYGDVKDALGRLDESHAESERARVLDPVSGANLATLALQALRRVDTTGSLQLLEQALALDPTQPHALRQITSLLFDRGDSARFLAMQDRLAEHTGIAGASAVMLRRAWQTGGRDAALRAQIAVLDSLDLPYEAARWRMKARDVDGVFRDLDRAYNAHVIWMPAMKYYFTSPAVMRDPRFKALLAKMKIAEDKP
ncbi:MAG: protein kinase [bacterium]